MHRFILGIAAATLLTLSAGAQTTSSTSGVATGGDTSVPVAERNCRIVTVKPGDGPITTSGSATGNSGCVKYVARPDSRK